MAFQLTISRRDLPPSEQLKRKPTLKIDGTMAIIGGAGCDCQLEGLSGTVATISRQYSGDYAVVADGGAVSVNGKACAGEPIPLHSGDKIAVGDYVVQFHLCLTKARLSWQSAFLATAAKISVGVIAFFIFGFMFIFTDALRASDHWDDYAAQNRLTQRLDELRRTVKTIEKNPAGAQLDKLLLSRVADELDGCVRYVRTNENHLSSSQTAAMMKNLDVLEALMSRAKSGGMFPELPQPTIDKAVTTILNNSKIRE